MAKIDWENVTHYIDTVGTTQKSFSFNKPQEYVKVTTKGTANVTYNIGTKSGTLTPGQSVEVSEVIYSFTLTAVSGVQTIEVFAKEEGTEKEETATDYGSQISELTTSLAQRATKAEVDTKVAQIVSGTPKGTYSTLAALQTAFPTGTTGVYVVTADGNWYYWSGSAWTAGGVYQSTGISDNSIAFSKLDDVALKRFDYYTKIFKPKNPYTNLSVLNADNTHNWIGVNATITVEDISTIGVDIPSVQASKVLKMNFTNAAASNISTNYINKPSVPSIIGAWVNKSDLLAVDGYYRNDFGMYDSGQSQISLYKGKDILDTDLVVGNKFTFQTVGSATFTVTTEIVAEVNGWFYIASYLDKFSTNATVVTYKPYFVLGGKTLSGTLRIINPIVVESADIITPHKLFNEDVQTTTTAKSKWDSKKAVALGDSITAAGTYVAKIKEILKLNMYSNWGASGKSMANGTANGNGINTIAMTDVNWTLYDLATIFAGTNDFKLNVPLGTLGAIGDTTFNNTTFYGAYREAIEKALTVKPTIRLCLWTPLQRDNAGYDVNFTNTAGHKLIDYVNAVKELGKMYGLPVLDMYATSGFTKLTLATFTTDGLHPNEAGDQRIADYASRFLESI